MTTEITTPESIAIAALNEITKHSKDGSLASLIASEAIKKIDAIKQPKEVHNLSATGIDTKPPGGGP